VKLSRIVLLFLLLGAGCSTNPRNALPTRGNIEVPVQYIEKNRQKILISERPVKPRATLRAVPGAIMGIPTGEIQSQPISSSGMLSLDVAQLGKFYAAAADTLHPGPATTGLTVEPADTRFARVGTFIAYKSSPRRPSMVGFSGANTAGYVILVYFDRPCAMTGTVTAYPGDPYFSAYAYDVTIGEAGFHWLSMGAGAVKSVAAIHEASKEVRPTFTVEY
jgi:hypothetical protein